MSIIDYSTLKTAVADYLVYDDVDAMFDTFLSLAESRMNRELRIREMQGSQSYSSHSAQVLTLPSDYIEMIDLYETGSSGGTLEYLSPRMFWSTSDARSGTGQPSHYTIIGEELTLAPSPDGGRDYVLHYYKEIEPLTSTNTTNSILSKAPDLYLYAVLAEAQPYLGDSARSAEYQALFTGALASLTGADSRSALRPGARIKTTSTRDGAFRIA